MTHTHSITENYDQIRPHKNSSDHMDENRSLAYYKANLELILRSLDPEETRILELGPGTGSLARWLSSKGFRHYQCIEACQAYSRKLSDDGFSCVFSSDIPGVLEKQMNHLQFDLIIAIDMLEHVNNQQAFEILRSVYLRLSEGGQFIGQVPNVSALFGWNTQASDPTHQAIFNEHSLRASLKAAGFSQILIHEVKLPRSPANLVRSVLRRGIFAFAKLVMRIVGASPVSIFTHLMIAQARK